VGRVVEDGTDEGGADGWVGGGGEGRAVAHNYHLSFSLSHFLLRGTHIPGSAHSAPMRAEEFLSPLPRPVSFVMAVMYGGSAYPFRMKDQKQ